uniref:Uncharacterized protein n=1 Tax=Oryza barthii TaxID=65489 RepID=A0A0D3GFS2_9ORYZ
MRVTLLLLCVFVSMVGVVRAFAAQGIDALPTIAYEPAGAAKKDSVGGACTVRETETHRGSCRLVGFQSRVYPQYATPMLLYIIRFQPSLQGCKLKSQLPTTASYSQTPNIIQNPI